MSAWEWRPDDTVDKYRPDVGDLVPIAHKVWRVVEVRDKPEHDWTDADRQRTNGLRLDLRHERRPFNLLVVPVNIDTTDPVKVRNATKSYSYRSTWTWPGFRVYRDEHYPICSRCGEPTPCRERLAGEDARRAVAYMARYEDPDRCPACEGVITSRQRSVRFEENLVVPLGPPVAFHSRAECRRAASRYETQWAEQDPANRHPTLSCAGWVTNHADETYSCTADAACPGPTTFHEGYATCTDRGCCPRGPRDCHPWAHYTRREMTS